MRNGNTLDVARLRSRRSTLEFPAKLTEPPEGFIFWQVAHVVIWWFLGSQAAQSSILPPWVYLALPWLWLPAVLFFSVRFTQHYVWLCTCQLPLEERQKVRRRTSRVSIWMVVALPVLWPYLLIRLAMHGNAVNRAWTYWFFYNANGHDAPGLLVTPAGSWRSRAWLFRLCVFLCSAAHVSFPLLPVAVLLWPPACFIVIVASLVIAPSLSNLENPNA